jgi:NAD(P)-dependent dehydrogenase (short-subunit alcohol dehydrogenase family)
MDKQNCIITGANSGIGKAAAIQIALAGYKVILACRNIDAGEEVASDIKDIAGKDSSEFIKIDMSSKKSIRDFADIIKQKYNHVDVLIHNAAQFNITEKNRLTTNENIEKIWATNHIGPVLLTQLLLEELKKSEQGRVITVASQGLQLQPGLKISFDDPEFMEHKFSVPKAYYQSKLAQVMYTYWLAGSLKNTNVTANCIRVTNVKVNLSRYPGLPLLYRYAYKIKSHFSITPEEMAETYKYLAVSEDVSSVTGKYFDHHKKIVSSSKYSYNKDNIETLMKVTGRYLG